MAKAVATCTCKKCGKTFEMFADKHNRSEADSWKEWAEDTCTICPECVAAERAEKAESLAKDAKENGLAKLFGTEKQIVWAEQLRAQMIASFKKFRDETMKSGNVNAEAEKNWNDVLSYFESKAKASWWIDNRTNDIMVLAAQILNDEIAPRREIKPESDDAKSAANEATVTPEENTKPGVVEVKASDSVVSLKYIKDEDFRLLVRDAGFTWNRDKMMWERGMTIFTGSAEDRGADIANTLLRNGFAVRIFDNAMRKKAVDASFEQECKLWVCQITAGKYSGWFWIMIPRGNEELYQGARRIPGSLWVDSRVIAPANSFDQVTDFAEINGYRLTPGAISLAKAAEIARENAIKPKEPKKAETPDRLAEILSSDESVLDELKDE